MSTSFPLTTKLPGKKLSKNILLFCGMLSSLLYVAMTIFVPLQWPGYNSASQVISELSAVDAPSRQLWVPLGIIYTLLTAAFGCGIWITAGRNRLLGVTGALIFFNGVLGLFWPPMHQREVLAAGGGTMTDTMHIVFSFVTVLLFMLSIGFGAAALGKRFRIYSLITMTILIVFGILTGMDAPEMEANLPTPLIGVWERINIGVYMLWIIVLSVILIGKQKNID